MTEIPVLNIPEAFHIGTLDASHRSKRSYEAHGLSVSLCPEAWRSIAQLGGNALWKCARPNSLYVDILTLPEASRDQILEWAREAGLTETQLMWRTWTWDDENESWGYMLFSSLDDAIDQLDEPPDEDEGLEAFLEEQLELLPPLPCGASKLIEEIPVDVLTELGHQRSGGRIDPDADAADIAIIFWTEDVLQQEYPDVVGVWWREEYEPENLSAPRGAILPSRINEVEFTPVNWNAVPDDQELLDSMPPREKLMTGDRAPSFGKAI